MQIVKSVSYFRFFVAGLVLCAGLSFNATAQIKIGTNGATIEPSSILELESNNQGLLLTRLADTAAINALNPPNGMLIYLTRQPAVGLYVRKVGGWEYLTGSLGGNGNFNSLTVAQNITAGSFSGPLNGNATSANTALSANVSLASAVTNDLATANPVYPVFAIQTPGNVGLRTSTTQLSFVPNTGILTARGFTGDLVGNVTGNASSATDAVNASNTDITNDVASPTVHYPTFVSGTTGDLPQLTSGNNLTYIPQTGELRALRFSGALAGNATSADNALTNTITDDLTTAAVTYPTFVQGTSGVWGQRTSSTRLNFVPTTGQLSATSFRSTIPIGTPPLIVASTTPVANLTSTNALNTEITNDVATTAITYPTFVTTTTGYQNQRTASSRLSFIPSTGALTASSFVGPLNGNATSATTAVDATNTVNANITNDITTPTVAYPVFVNGSPGNQPLHVGTTNMSYRPSTGELTARGFFGPLTGNVTGTATAAIDAENTVNMRVTDDVITNAPMYPTFVTGTAGPLPPRVSSTGLSFIPSSGELTAQRFRGDLLGTATRAIDVTGVVAAVNGGTGQALYTPGDLLYAGTSTTLNRLPVGAPGTILRVDAGSVPNWSTAGAGTVINVSGVTDRIVVTDPTVSPIVDISPNYVGQTSITTLGNITSGTWNGTTIDVPRGGTGQATLPIGRVLLGNGVAGVSTVADAAAGLVLTSNGIGVPPTYQAPGVGDMVLAVDQNVTAPKRFNDGTLSIRGTGSGETTLRVDANSVGVATFPAGSYTLVGTTGAQTISGKTFATNTVFQGTTVLDVITNTSQATTGNITAGNFTGPLNGNVTGNVSGSAATAATFTTALAGEVTGGQNGTNTQVDAIGVYPRATIMSLLANVGLATQNNDNNTIVQRNAFGNFSAGTITANLIGNAGSATSLATPRTIFNHSFDGTADLTGIIEGTFGGTGVNNGNRLLTLAGNLSTIGANPLALTTIAATDVTLPITGTLYGTRAGSIQSSELLSSLANETGTGQVVFSTDPNLIRTVTSSLLADPGALYNTNAINPGLNVTTATATGTNLAGTILITITGGPGPANNALITVQYSDPFPTGSYPILYPANANAAQIGISPATGSPVFATGTNSGFTISSTATALPAGTYIWNYQVVGR